MKKTVSLILILTFVLQALLLLTSCKINVTFPDVEQKTEQASKNDSDTKDGTASDPNATEGIADSPKYGKVSADINGYKYKGEYYAAVCTLPTNGYISDIRFNSDGELLYSMGGQSFSVTFDDKCYPVSIKSLSFTGMDFKESAIEWGFDAESMPAKISVTNTTAGIESDYKRTIEYRLRYDKYRRLSSVCEINQTSNQEEDRLDINYDGEKRTVSYNGKSYENYSQFMDLFYYHDLENRDIKTASDGSYYFEYSANGTTVEFKLIKLTEEQAIKYQRFITLPTFSYNIIKMVEQAKESAAYQNVRNAFTEFLADYIIYPDCTSMAIYMSSNDYWFVKKSGSTSFEWLDEKPSLDGYKILESHSNKNVTIYVPNDFEVK